MAWIGTQELELAIERATTRIFKPVAAYVVV